MARRAANVGIALGLVVVTFGGIALVVAWDRLGDAYGYVKAYVIGWLLATETGRRLLAWVAVDSTLKTWIVLAFCLLLPTAAWAADVASSAVVVPDASGYTWPSAAVACTYLLTSRPIRISATVSHREAKGGDGV